MGPIAWGGVALVATEFDARGSTDSFFFIFQYPLIWLLGALLVVGLGWLMQRPRKVNTSQPPEIPFHREIHWCVQPGCFKFEMLRDYESDETTIEAFWTDHYRSRHPGDLREVSEMFRVEDTGRR